MNTNRELVHAYTQMVAQYIDAGWDAHLLTFIFDQLRGSADSVSQQMEREVERVYATVLPRIVRKPRSAAMHGKLPVWIGGPDYPVPKHDRKALRDIQVNDGQHVHAVSLMPRISRLRESLSSHINAEQ